MSRTRHRIDLTKTALWVALSVPLSVAELPAVSCGDVITANVVLIADLTCPSSALSVRADGIVIDLNGHTIEGAGTTGIGISATNRTDIEILGPGLIKGFSVPVLLSRGSDHRVRHVTVVGALHGVFLEGTSYSLVAGVQAYSLTAPGAGAGSGIALVGTGARNNEILGNRVDGYQNGIRISSGIDNRVDGNIVVGNINGIQLDGARRNELLSNTYRDNLTGLRLAARTGPARGSNNNRIAKSEFYGNGIGVLVDLNTSAIDNIRNRIEDNLILISDYGVFLHPQSLNTVVRYNFFDASAIESVHDDGVGTVLVGNSCTTGPC